MLNEILKPNMQKWSSYNIMKKKNGPKIETVKYLELIDQNKFWLI